MRMVSGLHSGFQQAELAFNGGTSSVELAPAVAVARDEGVEAACFDPPGPGLALFGGAAPLGRLALVVGPGELRASVFARGRPIRTGLDGGGEP